VVPRGGVLFFVTGDTTYKFWHQIMGQQHIAFPSFVDAIHLTVYPVLQSGCCFLRERKFPTAIKRACLTRSR